ncbi:hypothetical protein SARC_08152 [Sphaeroforma arctica JP610]|uniref:DNA-directed RNA polymerase I subunit RPA34 n=1 Tax=Sphaeroforma arctica JP610 TaxID=667725 RepID=A0A0L0FRR0_9EUKA|nr:hypothetical protein SARC_08152 [Sphaeroforma arctica JP610]KNC79455.1 hypothetical protein SARC_08152 [Sphaeroforma arctica JP610]|eukprot:XP_014153357.1 hypothetical protein SARC_08152 [Sphaeroforma arctica JP610]
MAGVKRIPNGFTHASSGDKGIQLGDNEELWLFSLPVDFDVKKLDGIKLQEKGATPITSAVEGDKDYMISYPKPAGSESICLLPLATVLGRDGLQRGNPFTREVTISRDFAIPEPKKGTYDPPLCVPPKDVKPRYIPFGNGVTTRSAGKRKASEVRELASSEVTSPKKKRKRSETKEEEAAPVEASSSKKSKKISKDSLLAKKKKSKKSK